MINDKFNTYTFYEYGYTVGFVNKDIEDKCNHIIKNTTWVGDAPRFADWAILSESTENELYYEEAVRAKMSYSRAPLEMKSLAHELIDLPFFDTFKSVYAKKQHQAYRGIRNFKPCSMGLWDRQEDIGWHNDLSDTSNFFILLYINDYEKWDESWGGHLKMGKRNEDGNIIETFKMPPINGSFCVVNNTNPLCNHSVVSSGPNIDRYTFGFRYTIE